MNYRHTYHAGNFADVLKHAVLALAIAHLQRKPTPVRVLDTHAGTGLYDLSGVEAGKTQEWREGIGRLLGAEADPLPLAGDVAEALAPYLTAVRACNPDGRLRYYPGSPSVSLTLLRPIDRLVVNELHPVDCTTLRDRIGGDPRVKVTNMDGWTAVKAMLPPPERRGIVLVDPPFEQQGELARLLQVLQDGTRRFANGIYLLWFPIKDARETGQFYRAASELGLPKMQLVELQVCHPRPNGPLTATGLIVLNPPHTLQQLLPPLAGFLAERLAIGDGARARVNWLSAERSSSR